MHIKRRRVFALLSLAALLPLFASAASARGERVEDYTALPPIHVLAGTSKAPKGVTPDQIRDAYHIPKSGGAGTVAIVTAYDSRSLETDLAAFADKFGLAGCTVADKCLEIHPMAASLKQSSGWSLETAMDAEWAHAVAPESKILVVEAASNSGPALLKAVDYARSRPDVVSVSMSWGGKEFRDEGKSDSHFDSDRIAFFAASGDAGHGAGWPASSPSVVAVGGTSLSFKKDGTYSAEKAWSSSGGGISAYEPEPGYQKSYSIAKAAGKRAVPDVSWNADPKSGFSVYHAGAWYVVGGTSAGAPQWAALHALEATSSTSTVSLSTKLYERKASADHARYFRDITSGSNGSCGYYCDARAHYDFVTGLGTPLTYRF